jgi:DNA-binding response OmpR family regulator
MEANNDILIIDDNPQNIQVIGTMVKSAGYQVAMALEARQALEYLKDNLPSAVILDLMMPDMDGFDVCRKIKEQEVFQDLPVLFLTARTEKEDLKKGFDAGAADYLIKPVTRLELLTRIDVRIKESRLRRRLRGLPADPES